MIPLGVSTVIWRILHYEYLAFIAIRFITLGLYAATSRRSKVIDVSQSFNFGRVSKRIINGHTRRGTNARVAARVQTPHRHDENLVSCLCI